MKVLVTGGAGFIGSHLAEELCRRGASVIVLDDLSLGSLDNLGWKTPAHSLEFVQGDVADLALVSKLIHGCDWVFHQAAIPSVPLSIEQPWLTNRANLDAALQLSIAARDAGVKRFMFASSSAIYGDSETNPKSEGMAPNPLSPYALQKYAAERYAGQFYQLYGLETVSFRYFNVFGPRQSFNSPYSGVIAKFCTLVLEGKEPTIFGDGLQSRDFVFVKNVVHANLLAAEAPGGKAAGKVFNVGCGRSINLLQLLGDLNLITGQEIKPKFGEARAGDIKHSEADIGAIAEALGYKIQVPWKEGLAETLNFYRK